MANESQTKDGAARVVLLNPPTASPSGEILLNLAYLSATLRRAGHEVLILDATAPSRRLTEEQVAREIRGFRPHFIGVTLTIVYIPQTYGYLKRLRGLGLPIVAGGPHANCLPEEVLENGADIVAVGEGEDTILELADHFLGRRKLEDIAGLCVKTPQGLLRTPKRALIKDLDQIPFPDYDSFPIRFYTGSDDPESNRMFWSIFSSRGCPYNCIFCSSHNVFGRTYRARSPRNVMDEVELLTKRFGTRFFAFQDDEAFVNKQRIVEFCRYVRESRAPLSFSARLRVDSLDEEMLNAMKSAGFRRLSFGIESFSDDTLDKINKKYEVKTIAAGFEKLVKTGFTIVSFNNISGFPWETPEHLRGCLEEISRIPPAIRFYTGANIPVPYPGTALYESYHQEYGFTGWWLKPELNSPVEQPTAFFMIFLGDFQHLYAKDTFWKWPAEKLAALQDFCWKLSDLYLRRCLSFPEFLFARCFSRASYALWRLSPAAERVLFFPLTRLARWLGLDRKVLFRYQG